MYKESTDSGAGTTRERLLRAAVDCLRSNGITGATSRAIAARAEANLGSITYHFGSKDELLTQALLGVIRDQLDPVLSILAGHDSDPKVRMLAAVEALMAGFDAVSADAPIYLEALLHASRLPKLESGVRELFAQLRGFLADQISEQRAAGRLPAWVDPDASAGLLVAVAHGVVLTSVVDPVAVDPRAVAAQFAALLLAVAS